MGFWGALFGGKNETLNQNIGQSQKDAGFASGEGKADVSAAGTFYRDILSGDPTKEAKAIAPETSAAQETAQQQKNQTAQFSPRSGGTAAIMAGLDEKTRAHLIQLLGGLQSGAASGAANLGTAEQGIGMEARSLSDRESQQRMENWLNSILGKGITEGVSAAESYALGGGGGGGS